MIYRITINDGEEFNLESIGLPDSPADYLMRNSVEIGDILRVKNPVGDIFGYKVTEDETKSHGKRLVKWPV